MGLAADPGFQNRHAHEELQGLDATRGGQVSIADGELVALQVDDMVVTVDVVGSDDAGNGLAEESRDIRGRKLSRIKFRNGLLRAQQAGRLVAEGRVGPGIIDPEGAVDPHVKVVITEDDRQGH